MPETKSERSGWRDEGLSQRHRKWGWDCPALDLDFLLVEYDHAIPCALVEYKNEHAAPQYASHPSYQTIIKLGNDAGLPVIACRYADDFKWWRVTPLNKIAKQFVPKQTEMDEKGWVSLLYKIRGYEVPQSILDGMDIEV